MTTLAIDIRPIAARDAVALAAVCDAAWTQAYRGIIPDLDLRRVAGKRGTRYWRDMAAKAGERVLVLSLDDTLRGYVALGHNRARVLPAQGEIFELYLDPVCQGLGLGRRLFHAARDRLRTRGLSGLVVWALSDNGQADAFYRQLGGEVGGEDTLRFCGRNYRRIAYLWR